MKKRGRKLGSIPSLPHTFVVLPGAAGENERGRSYTFVVRLKQTGGFATCKVKLLTRDTRGTRGTSNFFYLLPEAFFGGAKIGARALTLEIKWLSQTFARIKRRFVNKCARAGKS